MKPETNIAAETTYKQLFSKVEIVKAPPYIWTNTDMAIHRAEVSRNRTRAVIYALMTCLAVAACVPAIKSMVGAMVSSGFTSYMSVLITDGGNLLGSWKEFSLALIESLPILSVTGVVALLVGSVYSFSRSTSYIKSVRSVQI